MKIFSWFVVPPLLLLFWLFFKIGLVFFGGGYVLIPVMHRELVTNLHLLTEREFIDGTAISQLTPGPIAILATFAGYRIAGILGALTSTVGMFLPGITLMLFISKNYEKIKNSQTARNILNTITPVIVGLLVATSFQMGKLIVINNANLIILIAALYLFLKHKINPAILIVISAFLGLILHF